MGAQTGIEWTDATWTPIRARNRATGKVGWFCIHESEACRFCYAEVMNRRLGTGVDYKAQVLSKSISSSMRRCCWRHCVGKSRAASSSVA
jgi:protein gp37